MAKGITSQLLIALTRLLRPLFGISGVCRYTITCSAYARYALNAYTLPIACWRIVKRIICCNFLMKP